MWRSNCLGGSRQCYCYPAQDSGIPQVQYSRITRWGTLEYLLATRIEWAIPSGNQRGLAGKCISYSSMIFPLAMDRMFTCHGLAEGNISLYKPAPTANSLDPQCSNGAGNDCGPQDHRGSRQRRIVEGGSECGHRFGPGACCCCYVNHGEPVINTHLDVFNVSWKWWMNPNMTFAMEKRLWDIMSW